MVEIRESILELLAQSGKPTSVRELAQRLGLKGEARRELKTGLRQLLASGEIIKVRGTRVGLPQRMNLVVGRLQCSAGGYGFVVPEKEGQAARSAAAKRGHVFIAAMNLKQAMHGDRVVARVERVTAKGAEGRIIRVLERACEQLVGRYEGGGHGGYVVPFDRRVLHEVFVPPGAEEGTQPGEMVVVEITRPPTATRNPHGRVLRSLGRLTEPGVDLKVIMAKYGLPEEFPQDVEREAQAAPQVVGPEDVRGRTDFRSRLTVTIDPADARDHDDAVGLVRLPSGNWQLAVHIADVAHYVREGGAVDQEAFLRGTSVYFPDRVVPMLPHALSSHICSLVEEDRLAQSALIELDAAGRVVRSEFHDSVIRSTALLSYAQAQAILEGDPELCARHAALVPMLNDMQALAKEMRARRYERGALDLDMPEPRIQLDAQGRMTAIEASERLETMRLIEEFMLAANEAVAERLSSAGVAALYRIHESPDPERVEEFCQLVASFGYRLPPNVEGARPEDFQQILRQIAGKPEERLVSYLLLRTMKLARYYEENLGHFGLATEMYAHFTSPIRRYPDLVAHRALRLLRQGGDPEREERLRAALPEMGRHLSDQERRADEAERELIEWKKVRFMADKVGETFAGYITGVQAYGLFVELLEYYVQGLVHVSSMADDYYLFNEKGHTLKGEGTRKVYRLGDQVEVQVARVDLDRRMIDFVLPGTHERAARERPSVRGSGRGPGRARR